MKRKEQSKPLQASSPAGQQHIATHHEDLFILFSNVEEKKKNILMSIKDALVMQDEYERVLALRKQKTELLIEVKKGMLELSNMYADLKKLLPNVKNVLSYTEKELSYLEQQIVLLKNQIISDEEAISLNSHLRQSIERGKLGDLVEKKVEKMPSVSSQQKFAPVKSAIPTKPATKLDRIKNNLKVIEGKLKGL